jgi:serine/threonine protein kinase
MAKFQIGAHIGSGGFGTVDEATEINERGGVVQRGLARKKLLEKWLGDDQAIARFKREVRMLDEMDHPNIITVLGRNLSAKPPWFVTRRADSNLHDEIHHNGKAGDRDWVVQTFRELLKGMAYAHGSRVVHRDLKPENILFVDGVAVISDFGLGKRLDTNTVTVTQSHIGMGTLPYMAPEQFVDAAKVSYPADCYALGKILRTMLTGQNPPIGAMKVDDVPGDFCSFIERCVADDEADRYASAADALAAFDLLIGGSTSSSTDLSQDGLEVLLSAWESVDTGDDQSEVKAIAKYLAHNDDDEELYFNAIPRLPRLLIDQMNTTHPELFDKILRAYNTHVQGALPFDYCDVLANFYSDLFAIDDDLDHRALMIERLIELGPTHNRWHVGEVLARILSTYTDKKTAKVAAKLIRANASYAAWFREYIENRDLPDAVRDAFADVDPT